MSIISVNNASDFLRHLGRLESWLCVSAFAILALVLFLDVLLRTVLGNGLAWSHQAGVYANMVVSLIGIGMASANGAHLRPRFADRWLPVKWEPIIMRLQSLVSALFYLFFSFLSVQLVIESYQLQERSTVLQIPIWPVQSLLPLAFALAFVRAGLFAVYPQLQPKGEVGE